MLPLIAVGSGTDVSTDELFSDAVLLTNLDGSALDIDGDGNVDLAVATNRGGPAGRSRYYPGNGDGTFGAPVLLTEGPSSDMVAADLNGDTFIDLMQARRDDTTIIHLGDGAGGVTLPGVAMHADTNRVLAIAVGDLDGDGDLDVVAGNGRAGGVQSNPAQPNRYYVNDGAGNFSASNISADADMTRGIALADIDGDGLPDVIAGNDETTAGSNRIYLNTTLMGTVSFAAGVDFGPADDQTSDVLIGDLDGDGDPDIVTINNVEAGLSPGTNRFFINESQVGVVDVGTGQDVSSDTDKSDAGVLADFDGDGDLDLAVANALPQDAGQSALNRLYLNQFAETGAVSFVRSVVSLDEHQSRDIAAADIDGDGDIDLVVGNEDNVAGVHDRIYLNNGTAAPFDDVPVFTSTAVVDATEDSVYTYNITTADPDSAVAITAPTLPGWLTLTDNSDGTATLIGTPGDADVGNNSVSLQVSDGSNATTQDFTIVVAGVNDPPSFTSGPVTTAQTNVAYTYNITTSDPDTGDTLTIAAPTLAAWLTLTDNGDGTAVLSGTPADSDVGGHAVSLEVSDGAASATQDFTITVGTGTGGNNTPAFTSTPITDATAGTPYTYDVSAADADPGDTLAITAVTLPAWLTLADNGDGTATLTGTPADGDVGGNEVVLRVSDGTDSSDQAFTVTVASATPGNTAPTFTSTPVTDATAGTAYSYDVAVTDPDASDTIAITAPVVPTWLTFTDNGDGTATLTGTPADGDVGDNDVVLRASDGTDTTDQAFTINVVGGTTGNNAPSFTSTAVTDANEGDTYTYEVTATDPDPGDALEITAPTLPTWLTLTDNGDGTATLSGTPQSAQVGEHAVSLQVSDGTDSAVQDFTITVAGPSVFPPPGYGSGSGGGAAGVWSVLALGTLVAFRRRIGRTRS